MTLDNFLNTLTPMQVGRTKKTLNKVQGFNGDMLKRKTWCEKVAQDVNVVIDHKKGRIYLSEKMNFFFFKDVSKAVINYIDFLRASKI